MSQILSYMAIRQLQTLSSSILRVQATQSSRYFSVAGIRDTSGQRTESNLSQPKTTLKVPQRTLYTQDSLGLDRVRTIRENKLQLYQNHKDRYIERLAGYLESGNVQSILKDDLTNLIGLSENEEHLDLLEKVIASLKTEHDYSTSGWGTAVVRLYCSLNQVDRVYNNLKDYEKYGDFFNQYTSYRIALTMLYNAGRYNEVVEIYELGREKLKSTRTDEKHYPGLAVVAAGALCRLNTEESLGKAEQLYNEVNFNDNSLYRLDYMKMRFIMFLSYLALALEKPALAINLISDAKSKNFVALRELKTLSLLKLKRYEDLVYHLRDSITRSKDSTNRERMELILGEVHKALEDAAVEIPDESTRQMLTDTLVELKQANMVGEASVESLIYAPIKARPNYLDFGNRPQQSGDRQRFAIRPGTYNNNRYNRDDGFSNEDRYVQRNQRSRNYEDGSSNEDRYVQRNQRSRVYEGGRRGNFNERPQRAQSKSYFEDDLDDVDDDAISTQKRFR